MTAYSKLMFYVLQEGPRTMVGIATYDVTIHFYNLKRALQQVITYLLFISVYLTNVDLSHFVFTID